LAKDGIHQVDGRSISQRKLAGRHRTPVSFTFDPKIVKDLDLYALEYNVTRSFIVENLIRRELHSFMEDVKKMIEGRKIMEELGMEGE